MNTKLSKLIAISILFIFLLGLNSCSKESSCTTVCQNDGILTIDCECACPAGFAGELCETSTCTLTCQNGGTLTSDCTCDCPPYFEGASCENCISNVYLVNDSEFWISSGSYYVNDLEVTLPERYALTGVGFSMSTLVLTGRELLQNGTLGPAYEFRGGPDPSGAVTVSYTAPAGHVITGMGYGIGQYTNRLIVNYNEVLTETDCSLYLGPEKLYDNSENIPIELWLKVSGSSFSSRRFVFGRLGLLFGSNKKVETQVRHIYNVF